MHSPAIPSQRICNTTLSSLHHEKPLTITNQLLYTSHRPTLPVSQTYNRTEEIPLSFSVFIISLLILLTCIKLKLYLCCRRDRRENSNQVIPMSFTSSSSSGSSITLYFHHKLIKHEHIFSKKLYLLPFKKTLSSN